MRRRGRGGCVGVWLPVVVLAAVVGGVGYVIARRLRRSDDHGDPQMATPLGGSA